MTRMTDEETWSRKVAMVNALPWAAQRDFWREEAERARSEEARLTEEVAEVRYERDEHARVRWEQASEIIALRQQVETLLAGQQSNGEARQQAIYDFACELAEMEPAQRDTTIRRIIDQRDNP